ncbi:MAG: hypothetical protein ACLFO2_00290 [Candidatus Woesearchaeota archaeon]
MFIAKTLSFYKRPEVQRALVEQARDKEVSVRFQTYFGKRPDALFTEGDVLEFAKRKASSFHCSEELWSNPLHIETGMGKKDIAELRTGWDLILDVDCPYWPLSKLITHLFIRALQDHGVKAVSVKFSGNKGFHVAVPFEAFPGEFNNQETKDLFPEAPKKIAKYLLDYIVKEYTEVGNDEIRFSVGGKKVAVTKEALSEHFGKPSSEFFITVCDTCGATVREAQDKYAYTCGHCGHRQVVDERMDVPTCPACHNLMQEQVLKDTAVCDCHKKYSPNDSRFNPVHREAFDPLSVVEVDTILLAHRHLYRMPYSFHEKSQLVSVPIPLERVLSFSKEEAEPDKVGFDVPFLDRDSAEPGEAASLLTQAYDHDPDLSDKDEGPKEYALPEEAIPEDYFPPCIRLMLEGLKDGRKRALFTLINFLRGAGWSFDAIEATLMEWNQRNEEPLREVEIKGRVRYEKSKKEVMPPHNCKQYYQDFGVCRPDEFCNTIKNPLQYAKKKAARAGHGQKKGGRQKLTDEQKEMRRKYRERKKAKESSEDSEKV